MAALQMKGIGFAADYLQELGRGWGAYQALEVAEGVTATLIKTAVA